MMTKKLVSVQAYHKSITALEEQLKNPELPVDKVPKLQERLVTIAKKYQDDESIGRERYRMYELQGLIFFYEDRNRDALRFLDTATTLYGGEYDYASSLKKQILSEDYDLNREYVDRQKELKKSIHRHRKDRVKLWLTALVIAAAGLGISFRVNDLTDREADENLQKVLDVCAQDPESLDCGNIKQKYNATVTCDSETCKASIPVIHWYIVPVSTRGHLR